jgi:alpha-tubulin suppressor-like RCC1 family protein
MKAVAAGSTHTVYLTEGGEVWTTGGNYWGQLGQGHNDQLHTPVQVSGLFHITQIAAGKHHTLLAGGDLTWLTTGQMREALSGDGAATEWNTFNKMFLPDLLADSGR